LNLEQRTEDENRPGPQIGKGDLRGSMKEDGELWINLNPDWVDHNVYLTGRYTGARYSDFEGTWVYSTFAGGIDGGRFEAKHR
jgi:hypothetical protein